MAEVNIIKIDGKPLEKLIDVISKGIGTIYRPRSIRKEADAEAYKIEIIERAKSKAIAEGKEIDADTYDRLQDRILNKELRKQQNIDAVSQVAAEQLSQEESVSEEPVDGDWSTRFFNIVEDISDQEMQNLWGRILAGEVKEPKSYSLRTLDLIKNLSSLEANTFIKVANFAISAGNDSFIYKAPNNELETLFKIGFGDFALLIEVGLIQPGDFLTYKLLQSASEIKIAFTSGNIIISILRKSNVETIDIPIFLFTKVGKELLKLMNVDTPFEYLELFAKGIKKNNVEVKYGYVLEKTETHIKHTIPLLDFNFEK